ncbi:MAG: ATP-binding protein, partial [Pseudomonadota bacterium]
MRSVAFCIPNEYSHVALVTRCVLTLASHVTGEDSGVFETAVGEALNNIIEHSYGADTDEQIRVELSFDAESLELTIEDGGSGMSPAILDGAPDSFPPPTLDDFQQLPEGGFGLTLIKLACDEVSYVQEPGCNRLTMIRAKRPEHAQSAAQANA